MPRRRTTSDELPPTFRITDRQHHSLLGLIAACFLAIACYWMYLGGHHGGLVEIDRVKPLTAKYLVDINRAEWAEIVQLPEVGEMLAQRIVDDRKVRGPFRDIDDLDRVDGVGLRTLERLRPYLLPIPKDTDWAGVDDPNQQALP